jgi:hypothetical protein
MRGSVIRFPAGLTSSRKNEGCYVNDIRPSGFYWVQISGDPEVVRWDATNQAWHLTGTDEGEDKDLVKVLAGPLFPPLAGVCGTSRLSDGANP